MHLNNNRIDYVHFKIRHSNAAYTNSLIWFSCRLPRYTVHTQSARAREREQYKYKQSYMPFYLLQFSIVRLDARSHINSRHLPVCVVYFDVLWNLTHDFSHCISVCLPALHKHHTDTHYINIMTTIDRKSRTINSVDNMYDACNCKCDTIYLSHFNRQFYSVSPLVMNRSTTAMRR